MDLNKLKICIVGLGYVGLPLAVEFGKIYDVVGFDTDSRRINELNNFFDRTNETTISDISAATRLRFTNNFIDVKYCNVFIITVPTPINQFKAPDLYPLLSATEMIGKSLKSGDIVVYESTVYPGCTEEECVPILEKRVD